MQQLIVALVVLSAFAYSGWALLPAPLKRSMAARVADGVRRFGVDAARSARIESALATGGGCSDCSSCKGCATPAVQTSVTSSGVAVVAMPVSRRQSPR